MAVIGVLNQTSESEQRVALTPDVCKQLIAKSFSVHVQSGAGAAAGFPDTDYTNAGCTIVPIATDVISAAAILCVFSLPEQLLGDLTNGQTLIGMLKPWENGDALKELEDRGVRCCCMENIPRTTRAQIMDVLSSLATVAGYKAVIIAAQLSPRFFPMLITAAGTIPPSKCVIIGAGVAGLQAIATAKRLGGSVEAYDIRPAAKEQVLSLGAKFIEVPIETADTETAGGYAKEVSAETLRKQQEVLAKHLAAADIVITTAAIPGRRAPLIVTQDMVDAMKPGSVIIDLAAETGGNCAASRPGDVVKSNGVTVCAPMNISSTVPFDTSKMYARNVASFLELFLENSAFNPDANDEIIQSVRYKS